MNFDPLNPSFPVGDAVADAIEWLQTNLAVVFDVIQGVLGFLYTSLSEGLNSLPYWVVIIVLAALAGFATLSWKLPLFTAIGFYVIRGFDLWEHAMQTISLVLLAVVLALLLSIPLGIWAARNDTVSRIVKPILDLMQTMPAMVYLIPAITIFGIGPTPGAIATLIFAMPPGVRLTELAIRGVDKELVEAGQSFGDTPGRILRRIQIPVALPTIMAGVNQVIMLALSMVVLAGMAGAGGLGGDVVGSLSSLNVPLGIDAGIAVVIIAIYLDRVSAAVTSTKRRSRRRTTGDTAQVTEADADNPATEKTSGNVAEPHLEGKELR